MASKPVSKDRYIRASGLSVKVGAPLSEALDSPTADVQGLRLRIEHARLRLVRGFEELLCLNGLRNVEHLPHQIETVRRVLRHFRGRVLLADEVGLGKTIEACLLLREYLLRGLVNRVLILTPASLVSQWREELDSKFGIAVSVPDSAALSSPGWWARQERILVSINTAKRAPHADAIIAQNWDLVIVDEAHHCKNRATLNWKLIDHLKRRYLFMLTATPVQNDLVELYNLLTLLQPGHLKTESEFKKNYVRRGNPRDPRNRERLRSLLGEVMVRNTRSQVNLELPPRYAETCIVTPDAAESQFYHLLDSYLRWRTSEIRAAARARSAELLPEADAHEIPPQPAHDSIGGGEQLPLMTRMQVNTLLLAAASHPATLVETLGRAAEHDPRVLPILERARLIERSAKERRLLELLSVGKQTDKILVFASFRTTLERLKSLLAGAGIAYSVFSGAVSAAEKDRAVGLLQTQVPVMLCSESGGEGRNLQFANVLINYDLPWNPMRIEQRVGRVHRIGQQREVFIFNLCTAGSIEERILRLLNDKIRMFELVVGEAGAILGNLHGGDEFQSLVLDMWLRSQSQNELNLEFELLGDSLVQAQKEYLDAKQLDETLFGEDYE